MEIPTDFLRDDEGKALQSIYRSKVQPQGTCVLNSGGQVLAWVLMFDKNKSVLDFLDHGLKRFRDHPDAKEAIMTERYMRFPGARLEDMKDEAKPQPYTERHPDGKHCPGTPNVSPGTVVARVIGRALDKDGKPSARRVNQEHLALDRFEVTLAMQEKLAKALADGGTGRVALPDDFARLCMAHAFLGNKDSGPMTKISVFAVASDVKQCEFWAERDDESKALWRVEGRTEVLGTGAQGDSGVRHEVKLHWEGFIELEGERMTRLLLAARGAEKLKWGSEAMKARAKTDDEVAFLTAGRFIDMECGVRYGIIGEPTPALQEAAGSPEKVATGFRMAEGPAWDGESLHFSDVPPSKILKLGSDGKASTVRSNTRWGAGLAFDSKRRLIICEVMGRRVTRVEMDGTEKILAESYQGKKLNGPNDLTVDAKDGIYFTDPLFMNRDKREQDKEAVYYIGPEGNVFRVADDLERPNGIALAGDGKTLFVADSAKSKLRAYPVKEDGTLGDGRDFGSVTGPDGVKVDLDGKVYAAGRTGIAVWDASGKRLGTLKLPVPPTSLAFGDKDLRMMYITTPPSVYKVRIDLALKILSSDEPAAAKEPPAAAPANPEAVAHIQGKIRKLQEGIRKWQNEGKDPSPIGQIMQEFGPLMEAGKVQEAEGVLDKALEALDRCEKKD